MANANLFQQYLQPAKSVVDYQNDYAKADQLRNANAMQAMTLQQAQNVQVQRNALRDLVQAGQTDLTTPEGQARAISVAPDVAPAMVESVQKGITSGAAAKKDTAQAGNFDAESGATSFKTRVAKANQAITDISNLSSPEEALTSIQQHLKNGDIDMMKASALVNGLQPALQDPSKFGGWQRQMVIGIMDAKDRISATAPKVTMANAGGSLIPTNENADAGPVGAMAGAAPIQTTATPGEVLSAKTSRANNAANIAKDYKVAGLDGQGNFAAVPGAPGAAVGTPVSQVQQLGDAIGKYQGAESTILARVPPALKGQVLAYVGQTYPDYNPSTYDARTKAARDFTSGSQGNALRSFAVAGQHLDQLGTLVDALDNGNVQIINKIGNQIGSQLGSTAPTNFDAAKDVVSKEVTKAIVAGGGGVAERAELSEQMSNAKTPAQLKGVISQYRNLMTAQHDALVQQRQAAGLPDSTLPAYSTGNVMAPGAFKITHVDGKPQ